jgi:ketosteroid isomerase-like protein
LFVLLTFGSEMQMFAADSNVESRNKEKVLASFEKWRNGTGSPFDLLAPNAKWTIVGNAPVSRTYNSKQEFMDVVIKPFNARMAKGIVPSVRQMYADGDTVIAFFDAEGTARDGKPYRNTYTWYMKMDGDTIVEVTAFFDTIEFNDLWSRVKPE